MLSVLLAEDDSCLNTLIAKNLQLRGFVVHTAKNGAEAVEKLQTCDVNIVVTDVMMPLLDGNGLVQAVKKIKPDMPVIMLTALDSIYDKKQSFNVGADDYMVKPVDFDELELRIRAILRRYGQVSLQRITLGNTVLDYNTKTVSIDGTNIVTTKKEFLLLYMLASNVGQIFSRAQLLDEVWGMDSQSTERTVDVHVLKLREKLTLSNITITSVRGLGYKAEVL